MPPDYLYRKYIDLIRNASSKYVNWDPLYEVAVGSYGIIDSETGLLKIEGNIYDPKFKEELDLDNVQVNMADFQPQEGSIEDDLIISTRGAKRQDLDKDKETEVPGLADASIKGKWVFDPRDKRDAILIMHKPRQISIPPNVVLERLFLVDALVDKVLVTSKYVCSAYSMYLSEKTTASSSKNSVSIALLSQPSTTSDSENTTDASGSLTWWTDTTTGVFRKGIDGEGKYSFTPLSVMKRPIKRIRRHFRDKIRPEPTGDEFWYFESAPWDPLDEEGVEDPLDPGPEEQRVDPFAQVFEAARRRNDPLLPRSERRPPAPPSDDDEF